MTLNIANITNKLQSFSLATGLFEAVNGHEPKKPPGNGLSCALWAQSVGFARNASGLSATTALLVMNQRIFTSMLSEPQDAIDPEMLNAVDVLFTAYNGDFDLGGEVRNIDLLGQFSNGLSAQAGYINVSGNNYRVMTITLPMVVNDAWSQA